VLVEAGEEADQVEEGILVERAPLRAGVGHDLPRVGVQLAHGLAVNAAAVIWAASVTSSGNGVRSSAAAAATAAPWAGERAPA
jgi:hypothetical protein